MARREELTDAQWALIEALFPKVPKRRSEGRPPTAPRPIMNRRSRVAPLQAQ